MKPRFLADKSALARMPDPIVRKRLGPLIEHGAVATCAIVDLEVLYSADARRYSGVLAERRALPQLEMNERIFERAIEVQTELAKDSQHRLPIPDLLVAAVAELNGVVILHYDRDYERIATITGQAHEWIVPAGSL